MSAGEGLRALLAAADEMEAAIADGDSAEVAAPAPGEVGRSAVMARRDDLYEDPVTWLREYANRALLADTAPVADEGQAAGLSVTERRDLTLVWHDATCPEGADCRDRWLHANAASAWTAVGEPMIAAVERILAARGATRDGAL